MTGGNLPYPIPNLINGVSQQAPSQRRDTQVEDQVNCINSPVDGAVARPPSTLVKFHAGVDLSGAFYYDIPRSDAEKHRVIIKNGSIRVYNLLTGLEATVNKPDGVGYLTTPYDPSESFRAVAVEDYLFIANKAILPAMNTAVKSPTRPYEAIFYFRGANFLETYTVNVTVGSTTYTWTMQTVSNAATANSAYVQTDFLAEQLRVLLTGGTPSNVAAWSGGTNLTSLGFTVTRTAFTVHISHATTDFSVKVSDGSAGTTLKGIKGSYQKFSDLPAQCVTDFVVRVKGENAATEDDYWVQFQTTNNSSGVWQEVPAPGTVLGFDAATMPWVLVSEGSDVFTFKKVEWGQRVSGDGVDSAKDPEFVGQAIQDIFFHRNRLGIMTASSATWSQPKQYFTYFPNSAQTILDTDPISYTISHTKVAILRDALVYNGQLMFWADGTQFVATPTGEVMKESSLEVMPATEFSYNPKASPVGAGSNVYFTSNSGDYSSLWEFFVTDQGTAKDANDITSQVPSYIPKDIICLTGSTSERILVALCAGDRSRLWVHNYYISGQDKLQSAWNRWDLPEDSSVQWMQFDNNILRLLVQRPDGASFEEIDCQPVQTDPGANYLTRLDRRCSEASVTSLTYNSVDDVTTFVVPSTTAEKDLKVVTRWNTATGDDILPPGTEIEVVNVNHTTRVVTCAGDITGQKFYVGVPLSAYIIQSPFYPKDQNGIFIPADRLQIKYETIVHSSTGYYRAEVTYLNGVTRTYEYTGRVLGSPTNIIGGVAISNGSFKFPVKSNARAVTIKLINDSWLPSAWQSAEIDYTATQRGAGRR